MGLIEIEDFYAEKIKNSTWSNIVRRRVLGYEQENCDKKIKEEYGQLQFCFQKGLLEVIVLVTEIAAALLSYEAQCYLFHSSILQNRKLQLILQD